MTQSEFEKQAALAGLMVSIPKFDMQVSSLAWEYITDNFKYVRLIQYSKDFNNVIFKNDIESESFYHYIKTNLPVDAPD